MGSDERNQLGLLFFSGNFKECCKAECVQAANACFEVMYAAGFWLTSEEAKLVYESGMTFVSRYVTLARNYKRLGLPRFPVMPKLHAMCETLPPSIELPINTQRAFYQLLAG